MNFNDEERRYKIFILSRREFLQLMTGELQITNIPEWSTILEVNPDFRTRGFAFLIHHPSFPEVEIGSKPEYLNLEFETYDRNRRKLTFK